MGRVLKTDVENTRRKRSKGRDAPVAICESLRCSVSLATEHTVVSIVSNGSELHTRSMRDVLTESCGGKCTVTRRRDKSAPERGLLADGASLRFHRRLRLPERPRRTLLRSDSQWCPLTSLSRGCISTRTRRIR